MVVSEIALESLLIQNSITHIVSFATILLLNQLLFLGVALIRFRITELMAEKQFKEGRRVTLIEIAERTGINRMTLSRMINTKGYSTVTDNLDKLCSYFDCAVGDIAEYVSSQPSDATGDEDGRTTVLPKSQ